MAKRNHKKNKKKQTKKQRKKQRKSHEMKNKEPLSGAVEEAVFTETVVEAVETVIRSLVAAVEAADSKDNKEEKDEESTLSGAALLLYSIEPNTNEVYFLLGKERRMLLWPSGSETWTPFGGARVDNESVFAIAAREFVEETLGVVRYFDDDHLPRRRYDDIENSLKNGDYSFCVNVMRDQLPRYSIFVKSIPFDPYCQLRFHHARDMLLRANYHSKDPKKKAELLKHPAVSLSYDSDASVTVNHSFMEKKQIQYWSSYQVHNATQQDAILTCRNGTNERMKVSSIPVMKFILQNMKCLN